MRDVRGATRTVATPFPTVVVIVTVPLLRASYVTVAVSVTVVVSVAGWCDVLVMVSWTTVVVVA
jgi:hypothetical protein